MPITDEELIAGVGWAIWHQGADVFNGETDDYAPPETLRARLLSKQENRGYRMIQTATPQQLIAATGEALNRCAAGKSPPANTNPDKIKAGMRFLGSKIGVQTLVNYKNEGHFVAIRHEYAFYQNDNKDAEYRDNTKNVIYCYNPTQIREIIYAVYGK